MAKKQMPKKETQEALSRKALDLKERAAPETTKPDDRTPNEGMKPLPETDAAPSGALDHAGQHPAMQRAKFARK